MEAVPAGRLSEVSAGEWRQLAEQRIIFGHQSVGEDVVAGVAELLIDNPQIPLRVVETTPGSAMVDPALYHARIGRNGSPASKLEAFTQLARSTVADSVIAMMKFCYVDVTAETDPATLFDSYRNAVESLRAANPGFTMVHVTMPLRSDRGTLFHLRTVIRGNTSDRQLNLTRHRYNELLRHAYHGREPLFDLAQLESQDADERPVNVTYEGTRVPVMASQWTSDGGHLSGAGRRRLAEALLVTLARLQVGSSV